MIVLDSFEVADFETHLNLAFYPIIVRDIALQTLAPQSPPNTGQFNLGHPVSHSMKFTRLV